MVKFIETGSRIVVARDCGEGVTGSDCLMGTGIHFGMRKSSGDG